MTGAWTGSPLMRPAIATRMTKIMQPKPAQPQPREVTLIDPSYQPSAAELAEDLRVTASFEELTAAAVRPVKIRYVKPDRKR